MDLEDAARENKLAELEVLRQSLEEKDRRVWELEKKIELLEGLLNGLSASRAAFPQPLPRPLPPHRSAPRRWSVR